jgi:hypothetical protein
MKLYPLQEHIFLYNYTRFLQETLLHSASGLPLCILTDEQEFHLKSVQLASQDKIFVLHRFFTSSSFFK